jgi:hypothetical protein
MHRASTLDIEGVGYLLDSLVAESAVVLSS